MTYPVDPKIARGEALIPVHCPAMTHHGAPKRGASFRGAATVPAVLEILAGAA